jgi:transposase
MNNAGTNAGAKPEAPAYVRAYSTTPCSALKAVAYDSSPSRAAEHPHNILGNSNGNLVCDDFAGYKDSFELGMT